MHANFCDFEEEDSWIPKLNFPKLGASFKLMCDACDVCVEAVLGKRKYKVFHSVYYASKTMDASKQIT